MARRRSKSRKRGNRAAQGGGPAQVPGGAPAEAPAKAAPPLRADAPRAAPASPRHASPTPDPGRNTANPPTGGPVRDAGARGPQTAPRDLPGTDLRPWRSRVEDLLARLRAWSQQHYAEAIEAFLLQQFGDPPSTDRAEDLERATEDYVCAPGSAGDGRSILSVFCDPVANPPATGPADRDSAGRDSAGRDSAYRDSGEAALEAEDRDQASRWERERGRGVFLVQHAARDRLTLWDPLEGAPITLHLLRKLSEARTETLRRGTVVTATYQPWMARIVAVGEVEFFTDGRATTLFREQTVSSGAQWHEAPPAAPKKATRKVGRSRS